MASNSGVQPQFQQLISIQEYYNPSSQFTTLYQNHDNVIFLRNNCSYLQLDEAVLTPSSQYHEISGYTNYPNQYFLHPQEMYRSSCLHSSVPRTPMPHLPFSRQNIFPPKGEADLPTHNYHSRDFDNSSQHMMTTKENSSQCQLAQNKFVPYTVMQENTPLHIVAQTKRYYHEFANKILKKENQLPVLTDFEISPFLTELECQYSPPSHYVTSGINPMENAQQKTTEKMPLKVRALPIAPEKFKSALLICYECNKIFKRANYLKQHNNTHHSGYKPFKCKKCGKQFACEFTCQDHERKHTGDKPYKCELCPKQFHHKIDLKRHMYKHKGKKPHACDTCGKGFTRQDHLKMHSKVHNREP